MNYFTAALNHNVKIYLTSPFSLYNVLQFWINITLICNLSSGLYCITDVKIWNDKLREFKIVQVKKKFIRLSQSQFWHCKPKM